MSWGEIKYALNSTLGTPNFKPLNEQLGMEINMLLFPMKKVILENFDGYWQIPEDLYGNYIKITAISAGGTGGTGGGYFSSGFTSYSGGSGGQGGCGNWVMNEWIDVAQKTDIRIQVGVGDAIIPINSVDEFTLLKGISGNSGSKAAQNASGAGGTGGAGGGPYNLGLGITNSALISELTSSSAYYANYGAGNSSANVANIGESAGTYPVAYMAAKNSSGHGQRTRTGGLPPIEFYNPATLSYWGSGGNGGNGSSKEATGSVGTAGTNGVVFIEYYAKG